MTRDEVSDLFFDEVEHGCQYFPRLAYVQLRFHWDAGRSGRAFAYCDYTKPPVITLSPRLCAQPEERIAAIIRHELAHALDSLYARTTIERTVGKLPPTPELMADEIASRLWGEQIFYDVEHVQTLDADAGVTDVRPPHLPE